MCCHGLAAAADTGGQCLTAQPEWHLPEPMIIYGHRLILLDNAPQQIEIHGGRNSSLLQAARVGRWQVLKYA